MLVSLSLDIFERVFETPALAGWGGFGLAVQAYQKRAPFVIDWLAALARRGALVRCLAASAPALIDTIETCWGLGRRALLGLPPLRLRKA